MKDVAERLSAESERRDDIPSLHSKHIKHREAHIKRGPRISNSKDQVKSDIRMKERFVPRVEGKGLKNHRSVSLRPSK